MHPRALFWLGVPAALFGFLVYRLDVGNRAFDAALTGTEDPGIGVQGVLGLVLTAVGVVLVLGGIFFLVSRPDHTGPASARQPCPKCGESIPVVATVCRFCHHPLPPAHTTA